MIPVNSLNHDREKNDGRGNEENDSCKYTDDNVQGSPDILESKMVKDIEGMGSQKDEEIRCTQQNPIPRISKPDLTNSFLSEKTLEKNEKKDLVDEPVSQKAIPALPSDLFQNPNSTSLRIDLKPVASEQ